MKTLLVAVGLVIIFAVLGWLSFQNVEIDRARKSPPPAPTPIPKQNFESLVAVLRGDMTRIPASLQAPRAVPSHAFTVKSQLQGALSQHEEYEVLNRVCDLLIYADQEHSVRQRDFLTVGAGPRASSLSTSGDPEVRRALVQKDQETAWMAYRQKTDSEVQRLLGMLTGKKL